MKKTQRALEQIFSGKCLAALKKTNPFAHEEIKEVMAAAQAVPVFDATRLYRTEAEFTRAIQPYQQAIQADARNARAHSATSSST